MKPSAFTFKHYNIMAWYPHWKCVPITTVMDNVYNVYIHCPWFGRKRSVSYYRCVQIGKPEKKNVVFEDDRKKLPSVMGNKYYGTKLCTIFVRRFFLKNVLFFNSVLCNSIFENLLWAANDDFWKSSQNLRRRSDRTHAKHDKRSGKAEGKKKGSGKTMECAEGETNEKAG